MFTGSRQVDSKCKQESLANAKVSVRQQCVYEETHTLCSA